MITRRRWCHDQTVSTVTLRPMTEAEFAGFRQATARAFSDELVATGGWSPEEALERSCRAAPSCCPRGRRRQVRKDLGG
jgi:hypothetical protein